MLLTATQRKNVSLTSHTRSESRICIFENKNMLLFHFRLTVL